MKQTEAFNMFHKGLSDIFRLLRSVGMPEEDMQVLGDAYSETAAKYINASEPDLKTLFLTAAMEQGIEYICRDLQGMITLAVQCHQEVVWTDLRSLMKDAMRSAFRLELPEENLDKLKCAVAAVLTMVGEAEQDLIKAELTALVQSEEAETAEQVAAVDMPEGSIGIVGMWYDVQIEAIEESEEQA